MLKPIKSSYNLEKDRRQYNKKYLDALTTKTDLESSFMCPRPMKLCKSHGLGVSI